MPRYLRNLVCPNPVLRSCPEAALHADERPALRVLGQPGSNGRKPRLRRGRRARLQRPDGHGWLTGDPAPWFFECQGSQPSWNPKAPRLLSQNGTAISPTPDSSLRLGQNAMRRYNLRLAPDQDCYLPRL